MRELFPKWLIGALVVPAIVVAVFYVVAMPALLAGLMMLVIWLAG